MKVLQPAPLWWRPPFVGNEDAVIAQAAREFVVAKRGDPYSIGEIIAYLRRRTPALRTEIAAAAAAKRQRAHDAKVRELTRIAA